MKKLSVDLENSAQTLFIEFIEKPSLKSISQDLSSHIHVWNAHLPKESEAPFFMIGAQKIFLAGIAALHPDLLDAYCQAGKSLHTVNKTPQHEYTTPQKIPFGVWLTMRRHDMGFVVASSQRQRQREEYRRARHIECDKWLAARQKDLVKKGLSPHSVGPGHGSVLDYALTHQILAERTDTGQMIMSLLDHGFLLNSDEAKEVMMGRDRYSQLCPKSFKILEASITRQKLSEGLSNSASVRPHPKM